MVCKPDQDGQFYAHQLMKKHEKYWDYYAFVDGSWKKVGDTCKAGIGGFIRHNNDDQHFIISGPTKADNPLQAETNANDYSNS